ncbi:hypothetical protein [Nocardia sp. CA-145437]|uniref:hypothetical protein n=1 Tax=Nocardia sp. CA-145437 TaxID=3239980 RepID=UPI003D982F7C
MNLSDMADALGGLLAGGIGVKLIDGVLGRRRGRTDVLNQLEEISGRLAARAEVRMREVEQQLADYKAEDADRQMRQRLAAARHTAWDLQVRESLRALGVEVAEPPPLEVIP